MHCNFQRGCVTGGGDKTVKFWQFELITDEKSEAKAKVLSLLHTRTLKLEDTVLCVRLSPNAKFIAVALLDSTVKIFFVDTFKVRSLFPFQSTLTNYNLFNSFICHCTDTNCLYYVWIFLRIPH